MSKPTRRDRETAREITRQCAAMWPEDMTSIIAAALADERERCAKKAPPPPLRALPIMSDAISSGIEYGVRRAFKHSDDVPEDSVLSRISEQAHIGAMSALHEVVDFFGEDPPDMV